MNAALHFRSYADSVIRQMEIRLVGKLLEEKESQEAILFVGLTLLGLEMPLSGV